MDNAQNVQNARAFQEQGRRTWSDERHPDLSRGWELHRDIEKAAQSLQQLDEHKRALFYGDDTAAVLRADSGGDYTLGTLSDDDWDVLHASLGVATEGGEVLEVTEGILSAGGEVDLDALVEEVGDILYYAARLADAADTTLLEIMQANNRKLRERFPEQFNQEDALERDAHAEAEAMVD